MATDLLWQRTQLGFEIPRLPNVAVPGYPRAVHQAPQRHVGIGEAPNYKNQLQFNLRVPLSPENLATKFRKPRPIIIEKLGGQPSLSQELYQAQNGLLGVINRGSLSVSSSISSDRLALGIHLARRDVKRSRLVSSTTPQVSQEHETQGRHEEAPSREQKSRGKTTKKGKTKRSKDEGQKEETISLRERVQKVARKQESHSSATVPPKVYMIYTTV